MLYHHNENDLFAFWNYTTHLCLMSMTWHIQNMMFTQHKRGRSIKRLVEESRTPSFVSLLYSVILFVNARSNLLAGGYYF